MMGAVVSFVAMAVAGREIQVEMNTFELMLYRSAHRLRRGRRSSSGGAPRGFAQVRSRRPWLHAQAQPLPLHRPEPLVLRGHRDPAQPARGARVHQPDLGRAPRPLPPRRDADPHPPRRRRCSASSASSSSPSPAPRPLGPGHAAALVAAVCFALNTIFTKQIMRHDSVLCVIFWMTLLQGTASLLLSLPGGIPAPTAATAPWLARRRRDRPHRALCAHLGPRLRPRLDRGADGVRPPAAHRARRHAGSTASRCASAIFARRRADHRRQPGQPARRDPPPGAPQAG